MIYYVTTLFNNIKKRIKMSSNILPKKVEKLLKNNGIKVDEIMAYSPFDLSYSCEYIKGFVVLTMNELAIVKGGPEKGRVIYLRGTESIGQAEEYDEEEYGFISYPFDALAHLRIERLLATNILYVSVNGTEQEIAAFTNTCLEDMVGFVRSFKKAKKDPDAFEEEKEAAGTEAEEELYCPVCGTRYPDADRKICPKCMNKRSVFFRTLGYFMRYKYRFIALFLCYFAAAGISLVWPYLSGTVLYDKVLAVTGQDSKYVVALGLLVLAMVIAKITQEAISLLQMTFMAQVVAKTVRDMKKDVFSAMGRLSINFFVSRQTGSLMTRVLSDADRVTGFYLDGFPYIFVHSFTAISSFAVMFSLNWKMAIMACILLPLLVVMSVKLKPKLWSLFGRRHRAERSVNSKVNDNLTGARVVKAFGQQARENERFVKPNERLKESEIRIVRYNNKFTILYNFVQEISSIWVWILGVILLMNTDQMQLGVLITFVGYVAQLNGPMNFFSRVFHMWTDSINSAQRMFEIMDTVPDIQEKEDPVRMPDMKGEIELRDVTFGYDSNNPVLKNIDLKIEAGELLGIVGRSGAGKTTLVNLISRLYDTDEGEILIDGVNVRDIAFNDLRRNVAMVSQDTYIFMGTVAENIAYASPDAKREDIVNAAMLASAHEFISNMPDGYDTVIGASGQDLSGGEKQRISIARAILADPKILILDEATASVDTETEKAIQRSINYLVKGRTTLSIAHRLSTLRDADRIVVIDNGRITEEGIRDELYALQGTYYLLSELQTKALALRDIG